MTDSPIVKLHEVYVVGLGAFPGRRNGAAHTRVGTGEDSAGGDISSFLVNGERLEVIPIVGE
jgi:hypothetical protein